MKMKAWCSVCDKTQPASFRRFISTDCPDEYEDLCCDECHYILATIEERLDCGAQEPVGYVTDSGMSAYIVAGEYLEDGTPLYTSPPDTAAQIAELMKLCAEWKAVSDKQSAQVTKLQAKLDVAREALEEIEYNGDPIAIKALAEIEAIK